MVDKCGMLTPMLSNLEAELQQGAHAPSTTERVEDVLDVLGSALHDGNSLVAECQTASTATLFFRAESIKERFRKVAERIAECVRNIPLAALQSTLEIRRDVDALVQSLGAARFDLSEEDKALFQDMREAVSNQGAQSEAQHTQMLNMFKMMEDRLKMQVSDMRQELQANLGEGMA